MKFFKKMAKKLVASALVGILAFVPVTAFANEVDESSPLQAAIEELLFMFPPIEINEAARDIALYDFDHLTEVIFEIFPGQNVVGRVFGQDLEEILALFRSTIYNMQVFPNLAVILEDERFINPEDDLYVAAAYLFSILVGFGISIEAFGHLMPEVPLTFNHNFFSAAHTIHHYELGILQEGIMELASAMEELGIDIELSFNASNLISRINVEIFDNPQTLWFYNIDPDEFDFDVNLFETMGTFEPGNITTYIIEPDEIAYFRIASFMNNPGFDSEVLFPFFEEVQDFEHLIIDIRGNGGGLAMYFPLYVVRMLANETLTFMNPEFIISSEITENRFEIVASSMLFGAYYDRMTANEFLQNNPMPYFNEDDLALLDYAFIFQSVLTPAENGFPFGGQIWLLTDSGSASASNAAAKIANATGFATTVGEPTSRVTGVFHTWTVMPNTGIAFRIDLGYTVDEYGRSIEEFGVIPQIANLPGMDALETVLYLIGWEAPAELMREVDGVVYVPLRAFAYSLDAQVDWNAEAGAVIITTADGTAHEVFVNYAGGFIESGISWVPLVFVYELFGLN